MPFPPVYSVLYCRHTEDMIVTPFAQVSPLKPFNLFGSNFPFFVPFENLPDGRIKRKLHLLAKDSRSLKKTVIINSRWYETGLHRLIGTAPQHCVGPATGPGVPLALHGSCVGRASHLCSLYTVKEAVNPILLDHAV